MKKSGEKQLDKLQEVTRSLSDVVGKWTAKQRMAKARFWSRTAGSPELTINGVALSLAREVTDEPQMDRWWSEPGFADWFKDRNTLIEKVAFARELGLDVAIHGIMNPCIGEKDRQGYLRYIREVSSDLKSENKEREDEGLTLPPSSGDELSDLDNINKKLEILGEDDEA